MAIKIRKSVFETNSSSMHSFVIRTDDIVKETEETSIYSLEEAKRELIEDGYVTQSLKTFKPRYKDEEWYFGRYPLRVISTFVEKFKYACASYGYQKAKLGELKAILKTIIPELEAIHFPSLMATDDYQFDSWLAKNNIDLDCFLFNKRYIIIVDGDEYCFWPQLVNSGLIDMNCIEKRECTYE